MTPAICAGHIYSKSFQMLLADGTEPHQKRLGVEGRTPLLEDDASHADDEEL
jgi:tetrahydromethanopterin S-methyltransferase subunit A